MTDPASPRPHGGPLTGQDKPVYAAVFSPDGSTLATGSRDNTMRLWDTNGLSELRRNIVRIACEQAGGLERQTWERYVPSIDFPDPCKP